MRYAVAFEEAWAPVLAVREVGPAATPKPRLLDRVREAIWARHYSRRDITSHSDTGRPGSRCHSVPTDRPRGQQSLSEGSFAVRMDLDVGNRSKCRITSRDLRHLREECALAG